MALTGSVAPRHAADMAFKSNSVLRIALIAVAAVVIAKLLVRVVPGLSGFAAFV